MATIRSYGNPFEIIDRSEAVNNIPNSYNLISSLGIFGDVQGLTTRTVSWEDIKSGTAVMQDAPYGQGIIYGKDDQRRIYHAPIPHYPLNVKISPEDIQGKSAYGTNDQAETVANVVARKLEFVKRSHDQFLEISRAKLLEDGSVYAPNGTVSHNFYTDLGVTRKEVDFVLGTGSTDAMPKIEETIAYIVDNSFALGGFGATGIVTLCHPTFFSRLIALPKVQAAYTYYASTQEPLRNRLASSIVAPRTFVYGGMTFIEYRGLKADGTPFIPAGEARIVPTGMMDVFQTYAAPALRMDTVNTRGVQSYAFENVLPDGAGIEIKTESNVISVCKKPQLILRAYSSN